MLPTCTVTLRSRPLFSSNSNVRRSWEAPKKNARFVQGGSHGGSIKGRHSNDMLDQFCRIFIDKLTDRNDISEYMILEYNGLSTRRTRTNRSSQHLEHYMFGPCMRLAKKRNSSDSWTILYGLGDWESHIKPLLYFISCIIIMSRYIYRYII